MSDALGLVSISSMLTMVVALQTVTLAAIFKIMASHSRLRKDFAVHTAHHNGGS